MPIEPPPRARRSRLAPLPISADSLALARLARERRPLVVITASAWHAQRLKDEIVWFDPELAVHLFPDWETLPYDPLSPHPDLVSERLETLYRFTASACDVAIAPVTTALLRLAPREFLAAHTFLLKQGQKLDLERLRAQLALAGYAHTTQVVSPGEFSFRGGLIDLFPMGSPVPYRIDLFDTDIESIRTFDVDTQRSIYPVKEVRLLPAREFPLDEAGRARFRQNFRARFEGDPSRSRLYKDVGNGLAPGGIEYYLPPFFETTATLFDYLPQGATFCLHHDVEPAAQEFLRDTQSRYQLLRGDADRPLLEPRELFLTTEELFVALGEHARIDLP